MVVTKKQVLALLALYAVTRGTIDELCPSDELTEASSAYDQVAFNSVIEAVQNKVASPIKE